MHRCSIAVLKCFITHINAIPFPTSSLPKASLRTSPKHWRGSVVEYWAGTLADSGSSATAYLLQGFFFFLFRNSGYGHWRRRTTTAPHVTRVLISCNSFCCKTARLHLESLHIQTNRPHNQ
uniref:Uncharacterized protein n=1 Tax=Rhipicephalus microplus TaxID=6941 RepID=A0A6G5A152_RHIMP